MRKSLDQLFVSRVRIKLLKYFLTHASTQIHLRGAVREIDEEINAVRRELIRLEEINLITSETKGNRKYYHLNLDGPFLEELRGMIFKSFGMGAELSKNITKLGKVDAILLLGNYIKLDKEQEYPVDLVVIGDPNMEILAEIVKNTEQREKTEINYTVLSAHDFVLRKKRKDNFIVEVLLAPKIMIYGTQDKLAS